MGPPEDARIALLMRLNDHAPLFPPAALDLSGALEELEALGMLSL